MATCSFCKKNYAEHKGLTVFTNDGRSLRYCSSKCRRNAGLGRDSRKINWVKRKKKVGEARKKKVVVREEKTRPPTQEVKREEKKKVEKEEKKVEKEKVKDKEVEDEDDD